MNLNMSFGKRQQTPFLKGVRDGFPIGAGYFAVAFSLGIVARNAGLTAPVGFVGSWLTRASAGEYGVYSLMTVSAAYLEVVALCFIANLRYLLMSTALTQKFSPDMPLWKRIVSACCVTDEIFGISIAYPGYLPMAYPVGATLVAATMWASGTAMGIVAGNILPVAVVSALSVALYGMFLAIIIPPIRGDRAIGTAVMLSFAASCLCTYLPGVSGITPGIRIVVLTIVIAAFMALVRPLGPDDGNPTGIRPGGSESPASEPSAAPIAKTVAGPIVEAVGEPIAGPTAETAAELVAKTVAGPIVEAVAEPVAVSDAADKKISEV